MAGISSVTAGILTGAVGGAAATVGTMNPYIIAGGIVVGATMGGLSADKAADDKKEAEKNVFRGKKAETKNKNALVEGAYNKKKAARGLDQTINQPAASGLSEDPLVSPNTNNEQNSLLG